MAAAWRLRDAPNTPPEPRALETADEASVGREVAKSIRIIIGRRVTRPWRLRQRVQNASVAAFATNAALATMRPGKCWPSDCRITTYAVPAVARADATMRNVAIHVFEAPTLDAPAAYRTEEHPNTAVANAHHGE
jgi:hypothetical protein